VVEPSKDESLVLKGTLEVIPEGVTAEFMNHTERKVAAGGFRGTL